MVITRDLARLYKCKNGTKEINQTVKNNLDKFPERFSWKLDDNESMTFLVKNFDQKVETRGGKYKNPRVFIEQVVAMLATILKTPVAIKTSIAIMDAFVAMRHHFINNQDFYKSIYNLNSKVLEHDNDIKLLQESLDKLSEKEKVNEIYFEGQIYDAYSKIKDIMFEAKQELIVIDNYIDKTFLDMIKNVNVNITLITSSKNKLSNLDLKKYNNQYHNLKIIINNNFHDRYFILDKKKVYHSGTSINYAGSKVFSINILEDNVVKDNLIKEVSKILK